MIVQTAAVKEVSSAIHVVPGLDGIDAAGGERSEVL
jgi:hypothetical protein